MQIQNLLNVDSKCIVGILGLGTSEAILGRHIKN